jgi:hypothetical protein
MVNGTTVSTRNVPIFVHVIYLQSLRVKCNGGLIVLAKLDLTDSAKLS